MVPKKAQKAASEQSGGNQNEEPKRSPVHTIAKARSTPATGAPKDKPVAVIISSQEPAETAKAPTKTPKMPKRPAPDAVPAQPDDSQAICVFAFRLTRSERDEIHAATGSAKASKFIRAIALAGARGDMKAVQEAVDEVQAGRE